MFNWFFGDPLRKTEIALKMLDRFANALIRDLDNRRVNEAKIHAKTVFEDVKKLGALSEESLKGLRQDSRQVKELKALVSGRGFISARAISLKKEIDELTPQNATEERLHFIKLHVVNLDKSLKLAENLAEWIKKNEKFIKAPSSKKPIEVFSPDVYVSDIFIKKFKIAVLAVEKKAVKTLRHISDAGWRMKETKSYTDATDLLGTEEKGTVVFRMTYYMAGRQIRVCDMYVNHDVYMRDLKKRGKSNYGNFRPVNDIFRREAA